MMSSLRMPALLLLVLFGLLACSHGPETGPRDIRWDRELCAECAMAVSDHYFSAQIRGASQGRRTKVHLFDDIGCAITWLEKQDWKNDARTEMWVTHYQSGDWIDARQATYNLGCLTPMDYGLGALEAVSDSGLTFDQAVSHVNEVNASYDRSFSRKHKRAKK